MPILFLIVNFQNKAWRKNGVDTLSCLAASKLIALPVFVVTLIYIIASSQDYTFSYKWLTLSLSWMFLCFGSGFLETYLFKYFPMTQIKAFGMIFRFILTALIDLFVFNIIFTYQNIIPIFLLFIGGVIINHKNFKQEKGSKKHHICKLLLVSLLITVLYVIQLGLMKELAIMQTNPLFFIVYLQTILFSVTIFAAGKKTFNNIANKKISIKSILLVNMLIIIYCFCEPYVLKELPLTLIVSTGVLTITLTYLYDLKTKDLDKDKKSLLGFIFIFIGVVLLMLLSK